MVSYLNYWSGGRGWYTGFVGWTLLLVILDSILRGIALWRSARMGQKWWFVALLVINSAGILPVVYLLAYRPKK